MMGLIASIFALGIGPLVYQTFGPMRRTDKIVSGFILLVIAGSLFLEVLPNSFQQVGVSALILALLGFVGPTLIEKLFASSASKTHSFTIFLGIGGLILHASIDGSALQSTNLVDDKDSLALAVILHRLPVGLTIWWLLKPLLGEKYALLTLLGIALATVIGYLLSMQFSEYQTTNTFTLIQAFVSGSLLHVVFHKPHEDGCMHTSQSHDRSHQHQVKAKQKSAAKTWKKLLPDRWEFLGMLFGLIILIFLHKIT